MEYLILIISFILFLIYVLIFNKLQVKKYNKLLSQKKSSETILGQISETIAPFLDDFPGKNSKDINFLGMPIDYIYFGKKEIKFIEVKSGKSKLSSKQRRIRNLIRDGKVSFEIYRIPKNLKK